MVYGKKIKKMLQFSFTAIMSIISLGLSAQESFSPPPQQIKTEAEKIKNNKQSEDTIFKAIDEVVITSLGIPKSTKVLAYSVQKISSSDLIVARDINVVANLQGNVAGLQVSPAATGMDGSIRLVLRGNRSLLGNNQPLVVYNGIIMLSNALSTSDFSGTGMDLGSPLSDINAADVKDISVLKGGNSAALYGSLGYNGVLIMEGNKGVKKKGMGITYSNNTYFQVPKVLFNTQTSYGQGKYNESILGYSYDNSSSMSWGPKFGGSLTSTPAYYDNTKTIPYADMGKGLNNYYQTGLVVINNISIENANDNGSVVFSYANTYNDFVTPGANFNRNQFALSGAYKINEVIKLESFVGYSRQNTTNRNLGSEDQSNVLKYFVTAPRSYSTDALSQNYQKQYSGGIGQIDYGATQNINPYFISNNILNNDIRNRFMASQQIEVKILKELKLRGVAGTDYTDVNAQENFAFSTFSARPQGGVDVRAYKNWSYNLMGTIEYNTKIARDFELNVTIGTMQYYTTAKTSYIKGEGFAVASSPLLYSLGNVSTKTVSGVNESNLFLTSVFGNLDLSYKTMVNLTASLRTDWTSAINQQYTYPAVSLSILPSEIYDVLKFNVFDYWKIRASYALLNNGGPPYTSQTTVYTSPGAYLNGIPISQYGGSGGGDGDGSITYNNPKLKPETTTYLEFGLDFSWLKKRVLLSGTYFLMQSKDQIYALGVPYSSGYVSKVLNAGQIDNSGIELEIKSTPIKIKDFSWSLNVNYSFFKSNIVSLADDIDRIKVDGYYGGNIASYNIVNMPYGQLYGYDYLRNAEGKIYYGLDGLPITNPNLQSLGSATPDFSMGIRNSFTFKGITLSILLDWRQGGKVYSFTNSTLVGFGNSTMTTDKRDAYASGGVGYTDYKDGVVIDPTKENLYNLANGKSPSAIATVNSTVASRGVEPSAYWGKYASISKNFIYDASFMKIREISLMYEFNAEQISKLTKGVIQSFSIGYVGRNIATLFSNTPNIDPESSFTSGNAQGIEFYSTPIMATHGFKITFSF